jgi:hypothetical protein
MFVILKADGTIRKVFEGTDPGTIIELAWELRCEGDADYRKRLADLSGKNFANVKQDKPN